MRCLLYIRYTYHSNRCAGCFINVSYDVTRFAHTAVEPLWYTYSKAGWYTPLRKVQVSFVSLLYRFASLAAMFVFFVRSSGIDICTFSILTLLFRVSEKVATPTSVVLMAMNTLAGFMYRQLAMGGVESEATRFFIVCVPVVVVGESLTSHSRVTHESLMSHSRVMSQSSRWSFACSLYIFMFHRPACGCVRSCIRVCCFSARLLHRTVRYAAVRYGTVRVSGQEGVPSSFAVCFLRMPC